MSEPVDPIELAIRLQRVLDLQAENADETKSNTDSEFNCDAFSGSSSESSSPADSEVSTDAPPSDNGSAGSDNRNMSDFGGDDDDDVGG